jgi:hypothetical protein
MRLKFSHPRSSYGPLFCPTTGTFALRNVRSKSEKAGWQPSGEDDNFSVFEGLCIGIPISKNKDLAGGFPAFIK